MRAYLRPCRLALTIAAGVFLLACSKPAVQEEPVRSVKVVTVGIQTTQTALEYAAEVKPRVESRLGFRVGGKLIERPVEVGQRVKAGQVLAQLDPQDLQLASESAHAVVAAAQTSRDLAVADFKRFQSLKEQNFISSAELERRDSVRKAAQAQLDQAQAQSNVQGNQAAYAVLRADVSGVVTAVLAERGQVVAAGSPVVQIAQDGARDVVFAVPEDKVAAIKLGSDVAVRLWSSSGTLKAVVREVAASADPITRTFAVKVALSGADDLPLGSTVTVLPATLQHVGAPVIKLPTSALFQQGQSSAVWVLDVPSMTVKPQVVQIATADGNDVVVASGLQPGMQVVVAGVHVLAPGQKVTIYKPNVPVVLTSKAQTAPENVAIQSLPAASSAAAK
nr:efflux RND transporter periplasmic adaptor subunit [uncultured Rhodoferax sp.]